MHPYSKNLSAPRNNAGASQESSTGASLTCTDGRSSHEGDRQASVCGVTQPMHRALDMPRASPPCVVADPADSLLPLRQLLRPRSPLPRRLARPHTCTHLSPAVASDPDAPQTIIPRCHRRRSRSPAQHPHTRMTHTTHCGHVSASASTQRPRGGGLGPPDPSPG